MCFFSIFRFGIMIDQYKGTTRNGAKTVYLNFITDILTHER
jgi:hypothetical protein